MFAFARTKNQEPNVNTNREERSEKCERYAIIRVSQLARRPLPRITAGNRVVAGGEESPNSEGQCAG